MPGQTTTFAGGFNVANIDHTTANVTFNATENVPTGLVVTVSSAVGSNGGGFILGTLKNTGTAKADHVYVYASFYDAAGQLIGASGPTRARCNTSAINNMTIRATNS